MRSTPIRSSVAVNAALAELEELVPPENTLVVMPEGAMLNYLSRRASSVPFVSFMPPEVIMFGEDRMIESLAAHPPDVIAIAPRDTPEYGVAGLGRGYGEKLAAWVGRNYHPTKPATNDGHYHLQLLIPNEPRTDEQ